MKKVALRLGYFALVGGLVFLNSCQDDPVTPNDGNGTGNGVDTTWVNDSTDNNGNDPIDSLDWNGGGNGDPIDSTNWNGGGNDDPIDSTYWNGGGNGNPGDSLGN